MPEGQIVFDSKKTGVRILLAAVIAASLAFGFFGARWQLGDMLAEQTSTADPQAAEIAEIAASFAPGDPRAKELAAYSANSVFSLESIDASTALFADTVRLSPHDFRSWVEYGRSLEQAGKTDASAAALDRAVELAPNYAQPHWQLGNFYLRQGETDEALRQFGLATRNNPIYRGQVFALVWSYFGNDPSIVEQTAADTPEVHAELASFYVSRSRPADALRIWGLIPEKQNPRYQGIAKTLAQGCAQIGAFREGVEFSRAAGIDYDVSPEQIANPGFESPLRDSEETLFDWIIHNDAKAELVPDSAVKHTGKRSVRMTFKNYDRPQLFLLWQNIAVSPNTKYSVSFWVRTENLRSGGPPLIEVANAAGNKVLAASKAFPLGTNDWQQVSFEFTTPDASEGI